MATKYAFEGLDYLLSYFTAAKPTPTPLYVGLFTSQTSSTVPSQDTQLTGSAISPYTTGSSPVVEVPSATTNYTRVLIPASAWGAPTTVSTARKITTAYNVTFPQVSTANGLTTWGTINGFFLATTFASTGLNTGNALFYSNLSSPQVLLANNQLAFPVFIQFSG